MDVSVPEGNNMETGTNSVNEKNIFYEFGELVEEGDTWYLLSTKWLEKWKNFNGIENDDSSGESQGPIENPGPIDNSGLLKEHSSELREHLVNKMKYELIPESAWRRLEGIYGLAEGQQAIARKAIRTGSFSKQTTVEIYPPVISMKQFESDGQIIKEAFSRSSLISTVHEKMRELFDIPKNIKTKIFIEDSTDIVDETNTLDLASIGPTTTLVLEKQHSDGSWQRSTISPPTYKEAMSSSSSGASSSGASSSTPKQKTSYTNSYNNYGGCVLPVTPSSKRKAEFGASGNDEPSTSFAKIDDQTRQIEEQECPNHKNEVFDAFLRLKSEKMLCDFVIIIEDEEIPVHSAVVAASSKYYEAMLTHNTVEKKNRRVKIHGVELTAGKQCIYFMYTGKTQFSVKNPENLIYAAELMQLPALTDLYFEFLKKELSVKNCLRYVHLAETFNRRSFANFFEKFSTQNFADVIKSDDFSEMSQTLLQQCLESVPGSGRETENLKWEAISTWVNENVSNRKKSHLKLFKTLKLEHFSEEILRSTVMAEPLVEKSTECKNLLLEALLSPKIQRADRCFDRNAQYIIAYHSESRLLQRLDLRSLRWERFARIPVDVSQKPLEIASVRGEVYLTSGDAVSKFRDGKLIHLTKTGLQPSYHQCIGRGTVIYIIFRECICKYNTTSNTWIVLASKYPRGKGFFVTSSDRFIYAMGGEGTETKAGEFDFTNETWEPIASMGVGRAFGAAVWFENKVYALGGISGSSIHTEFYSPESDLWSTLSIAIRCSHYNCKAFTIGAEVFIVGGSNDGNVGRSNTVSLFGNHNQHGGLYSSTGAVVKPALSIAIINLKSSKTTWIPSFRTQSGLACAVYLD